MTSEPRATNGGATAMAEVVAREIFIEATPETVWEFLVDPEKATAWMGVSAEFDVRPGGRRWLDIHGGRNIAVGEHTTIDPPRHIGFTWGWEGDESVPPGSSTVDVHLTPEGDGTRVRLEHRGLPSAEHREQHGDGWAYYLERLATVSVGGDPGPDQMG